MRYKKVENGYKKTCRPKPVCEYKYVEKKVYLFDLYRSGCIGVVVGVMEMGVILIGIAAGVGGLKLSSSSNIYSWCHENGSFTMCTLFYEHYLTMPEYTGIRS